MRISSRYNCDGISNLATDQGTKIQGSHIASLPTLASSCATSAARPASASSIVPRAKERLSKPWKPRIAPATIPRPHPPSLSTNQSQPRCLNKSRISRNSLRSADGRMPPVRRSFPFPSRALTPLPIIVKEKGREILGYWGDGGG